MPTLPRFLRFGFAAGLLIACAGALRAAAPDVGVDLGDYTLDATRLNERPNVDGVLDEAMYARAAAAEGFTDVAPRVGKASAKTTRVFVSYDDEAVYVAAELHDAPDSIRAQVTGRDDIGNSDWFGVSFNPYRDGITGNNFLVTAAGGQVDSRFGSDQRGSSTSRGDRSWDAVWQSAVARTPYGWSVEMRIPLSMLRFPKGSQQYWDINFERSVARTGERSFWRPVDPTIDGIASQMGRLRGLYNVEPGVRLQLTPFVTGSVSDRVLPKGDPTPDGGRHQVGSAYGAGLDLKYGLSEAFTLDMMLVPDFSSARADDQVLNLGPSEIQYGENRAFFREGTELFEKGGYFYSRRMGGKLFGAAAAARLRDGETAAALPQRAQLVNAAKVSGRTRKGLGIGVLNAVERREAVAVTTAGGASREVEVHPLSNYTVLAVDKIMPHNSSVSLVNTSVLRDGSAYDANLTAVTFDLRSADQHWGLSGRSGVSQQYARREQRFGHNLELEAGRIGGRLTYSARYYEESDGYNPNDLGYLSANNERTLQLSGAYSWFQPVGPFNSANVNGGLWHSRRYSPNVATGSGAWGGAWAQTRNFWRFSVNGNARFGSTADYQDARTPGRFITYRPYASGAASVSTDYRKPFALNLRGSAGSEVGSRLRRRLSASLSPRWRISDQLTWQISGEVESRHSDLGYVGHTAPGVSAYGLDATPNTLIPQPRPAFRTLDAALPGDVATGILDRPAILLGARDVETVELESAIGFALTPRANVQLRARHYWSSVAYQKFFELGDGGERLPTDYEGRDASGAPVYDLNFNAFSVNASLRWRFAPGSDVLVNYQTQAYYSGVADGSYVDNLTAIGREPIDNRLVLKVIYWLDGAKVLRKRKDREPLRLNPAPAPAGRDALLSGRDGAPYLQSADILSFVAP